MLGSHYRTALMLVVFLWMPTMVRAQFTFITNADNTLTITAYSGTNSELVIPGTTNGYTVTSIGTNACFFNTSLVAVTIPDTITSIGANAFEFCTAITNIVIPDSVIGVGTDAFSGLSTVQTIVIGNGVTK